MSRWLSAFEHGRRIGQFMVPVFVKGGRDLVGHRTDGQHIQISEFEIRVRFEIFVPELTALGKKVVLIKYPGENHGFYWGRSKNPAMPLKANRDADAFFRKSIKAQPHPIDETHVKMVPVS